jgi:hypothetical protein
LFVVNGVDYIVVFKDVALLLVRTNHIFELVSILLQCVSRFGHGHLSARDLVPIKSVEECVPFDFVCTVLACSKPLGRISIQQIHDNVFRLVRH